MADKKKDASGKKQDPRVDELRPDPSQPAQRAQRLYGLWGDSDRPGFRRLYLTSALDVYAEFRLDDVMTAVDIPPDQPPFLGDQATRVELRDEAPVDITRSRRVGDVDEFDLDVRFRRGARAFASERMAASSGELACVKPGEPMTDPCDYTCDPWVCHTSLFATCGCGRERTDDCPPRPPVNRYYTDTCATCEGATQCGTCYTDVGLTDCGTCYTQSGFTQCGTCQTDPGHTACGECYRQGHRR